MLSRALLAGDRNHGEHFAIITENDPPPTVANTPNSGNYTIPKAGFEAMEAMYYDFFGAPPNGRYLVYIDKDPEQVIAFHDKNGDWDSAADCDNERR